MSTHAHGLPHRVRRPQRWPLWLALGLTAAAAVAIGIDRFALRSGSHASRPALQQILDGVVQGGEASGVTAYVVGPHGTWAGAAGIANVKTGLAMPVDARIRIESNSKTWLTAVILQLAHEGKLRLDDTVSKWLPGLLRAHGSQITIRELLHDSSGLIDDNDVWQATQHQLAVYFARVGDPKLRAQLLATAARLRAHPAAPVSALLFVRLAAWQPLVAEPGTTYHHSNIGWNVAGLIAAKVGGRPLPVLYRERIFEPLGLKDTAFSPQGPIPGAHADGYTRGPNGRLVDTTAMHPGKFADGAIVTSAEDEARFLRAAMDGSLFPKGLWVDLYGVPAGNTGCGGAAYMGEGAGDGYHSYVWYDGAGTRVAVLLLNRDRVDAQAAVRGLYCGA